MQELELLERRDDASWKFKVWHRTYIHASDIAPSNWNRTLHKVLAHILVAHGANKSDAIFEVVAGYHSIQVSLHRAISSYDDSEARVPLAQCR